MAGPALQVQKLSDETLSRHAGGVASDASERASLLGDFLRDYCAPTFGGRSKREIDLLVFQLLIQTKQIDLADSQQSISRSLRIPIGKVKSLIYDAQLRDDQYDDNWFRAEILKTLRTSRLNVGKGGSHIKLAIDNPLLRKEFEYRVKKLSGLADYSFNSDILKLDFEIYALIIREIIDDPTEQSKLEAAIRAAINLKDSQTLSWKELVNEFLKGAARGAGGQAVDLSMGYLTGGASMFLSSAKKLLS
jgi:hypothetical protein